MQAIADRRGMPFMPSLELSPSWAHFNAWPLRLGTETRDRHEHGDRRRGIRARRGGSGAIVVQSNHPFIPYGYLASLAASVAPGGFNPAFDLLEINAERPDVDGRCCRRYGPLERRASLLPERRHRHSRCLELRVGAVRTFAHVDGVLTARGLCRRREERPATCRTAR